jgi:hypothetical protein
MARVIRVGKKPFVKLNTYDWGESFAFEKVLRIFDSGRIQPIFTGFMMVRRIAGNKEPDLSHFLAVLPPWLSPYGFLNTPNSCVCHTVLVPPLFTNRYTRAMLAP